MLSRTVASALALLAAAAAVPGDAAEPTSTAELMKILEGSAITYRLGAAAPLPHPAEELRCPSRDTHQRLLERADGGKDLIAWTPSPEAAPHFERAEELFQAERFEEAAQAYERGLAVDPEYGPGWLFSGDVPYVAKDYAAALARFRKALALDPTLAQGHRFAADALFGLGRLAEAKDAYVKALVYDPAYQGAFDGLAALGRRAGFTVYQPQFSPPEGAIGELRDGEVAVAVDPETPEWFTYLLCKTAWRHEAGYRHSRLEREEPEPYAWTFEEERECVAAYLEGNLNLLEDQAAETGKAEGEGPAAESGDAPAESGEAPAESGEAPADFEVLLAAAPPPVRHLGEVVRAGLLDGFVAFAALGGRCPLAAPLLPAEVLADSERYVRRFVIVEASEGD